LFSFRKPSPDVLRRFLAQQAELNFSYSYVGQTAATPPTSVTVDRTRKQLGSGEKVFIAATRALQRWDQFRLDRLALWPPETPIKTGEVVAVVARLCGVWWLSACRIVYVIDEGGPVHRFGFAYGTLPDHAATGEERFMIEWNRADDSVWYDILAFSRMRHPLARLGYPFARLTQRRFAVQSALAMARSVCER